MKKIVAAILSLAVTGSLLPSQQVAAKQNSLGPVTPKDVIYQIVTDRFYDGDPSNNIPEGFDPKLFDGQGKDLRLYQGGDWQGIIAKIPYLKSLGITAVWISAPYENRDEATHDGWTSYHGYHARNYFATNKHFGTMSDFKQLQSKLTQAGIKLIIDFVSNHSSDARYDGRLFEPDKDAKGNYCFNEHGDPVDANNDGQVENLVADPKRDKQTWFHSLGDRLSDKTTFGFRFKDLANLADYAQEKPEVAAYLEKAACFWAEKGVSGFRHDATLHMDPAFVKNFKDAIDNKHGPLMQVGEFFLGKPDPKYAEYISYPKRTGVQNLDFEFYNTVNDTFGKCTRKMTEFAKMLDYTAKDYAYVNQGVTFIDNHDVPRLRHVQKQDAAYHAALVALLTSRGIPNIYYGTEQYFTGADGGQGRLFMQRSCKFAQTTATKLIKLMADLRQKNAALAYGSTKVLYVNDDVIVYEREFNEQKVLVALNRKPDKEYTIPVLSTQLSDGNYKDELQGLLSGQKISVKAGQIASFKLKGGEANVWAGQGNKTTEAPLIGGVLSTMGRAGNKVYIYGTNLKNATVKFNNVEAKVLSVTNDLIVTSVPETAEAGDNIITVHKNDLSSLGIKYTVLRADPNGIIFHVKANIKYGESLHVLGSIPELGAWQEEQATESMLKGTDDYFLHVSVPSGTSFEYCFIKKDKHGKVVAKSTKQTMTSAKEAVNTIESKVYDFAD